MGIKKNKKNKKKIYRREFMYSNTFLFGRLSCIP